MAAADAELISGAALVSEWLGLAARIQKADLVLTGEGRFDAGSLRGKGPGAIAQLASALGKRVHVFAGQIELSETLPYPVSAITPVEMPLPEALKRAPELLAESIARELIIL
jgi:glycerate kinase